MGVKIKSYTEFFVIEIDDTISSYDLTSLRLFYTPIVKPIGVTIYSMLLDFYKNHLAIKMPLYKLTSYCSINLSEFVNYRKILEAVGLLKTFHNHEKAHYVLKLIKPLSLRNFVKNKILSKKLQDAIGENEFDELINSQMVDIIQKDDYVDITAKFYDVFEIPKNKSDNDSSLANYSIEDAITKLYPLEFIKFITGDLPNKHLIDAINDSLFLGINGLNEVIYYSYLKNDKKIVPNYVKRIASDLYFEKQLRTWTKIRDYLRQIPNNKNNMYDNSFVVQGQLEKNISKDADSNNLSTIEEIFKELRKI